MFFHDWLQLKAQAIAVFGLTPISQNNVACFKIVREVNFADWRPGLP